MKNFIAFSLAGMALGLVACAAMAAEPPSVGSPGVAPVRACGAPAELSPPAANAEPVWRLSVPRNLIARRPGDLRGSLFRFAGRVHQIDRMQWQRAADGTLMPAWIQAYDDQQQSVRLSWPRPGSIEAALPSELPWFLLRLPGRIIVAHTSIVGTNADGFLVFRELDGTDAASGRPAPLRDVLVPQSYACGITEQQTCLSRNCGANGCGDAPACACSSGSGGCDPVSRKWCDGECDPGYHCSTSVNNCRCESDSLPPLYPGTPLPGAPPVESGDKDPATGVSELQKKCPAQEILDPATGRCVKGDTPH